jgi:hypothetical protein
MRRIILDGGGGMANIEDAPRLRELCELASKEYDHDKLLDLVRQINDLLEKQQGPSVKKEERKPSREEEKKASPLSRGVAAVSIMAKSAEEWLELGWIPPARA